MLSRILNFSFIDMYGNPLDGGKLYTYITKTTTPEVTYSDIDGTLNTNPIILDARGCASICLDSSKSYRFVLEDRAGNTIWSVDDVTSSAHVKATIPFAVDEDHLKVEMVGGVAVLSLADSLVAKLKEKGIDVDG